MRVRSVFLRGNVHSKSTLLPRREAVRSSTGRARFSEGKDGAPGVPHPERTTASRKLPIKPKSRNLMEDNRVTNRRAPASLLGPWAVAPLDREHAAVAPPRL